MRHIVIIGAGECGARAALELRQKGYDGPLSVIGDEPVEPYERPPLSKAALRDGTDPVMVVEPSRWRDLGIFLETGVAVGDVIPEAQRVVLSDRRMIVYSELLFATGARPRQLAVQGDASQRIHVLRTVAHASRLRDAMAPGVRLAVIGGGFIGLEVAATARQMGLDVTVIEGQDRILARAVPATLATQLAERHRREGVDLVVGAQIASVVVHDHGVIVSLADGRRIEVDHVLVGIGAQPNVELAARAGLTIDNGIAVNERLETSVPGIWAAGDCVSFPYTIGGGRWIRLESWRNAQEQGALAAGNMLGAGEALSNVPWFWSDQYDLTLQVAGLAGPADHLVERAVGDGGRITFFLAEDGRLTAAASLATANKTARDIRLAEMLIKAGATPDPAALADPNVPLKSMIARDAR